MRNITFVLSYLGTSFTGWQRNIPNVVQELGILQEGCANFFPGASDHCACTRRKRRRKIDCKADAAKNQLLNHVRYIQKKSIQETIENALARILHESPKLQAASRTDAGVHAEAQVVNFLTENKMDLSLLKRALNGTLPKEIRILSMEEKPSAFHPTLDCVKKEYHYHIYTGNVQLPFHRNTSWHFPRFLNLEIMKMGIQPLLGTHDFSAFCNQRASWDRNPVCHLENISIHPLPDHRLCLSVLGDHFLYKMVRILIGTLVYVSCGKLEVKDLPHILRSRERKYAGITAPAHGLRLFKVYYQEV